MWRFVDGLYKWVFRPLLKHADLTKLLEYKVHRKLLPGPVKSGRGKKFIKRPFRKFLDRILSAILGFLDFQIAFKVYLKFLPGAMRQAALEILIPELEQRSPHRFIRPSNDLTDRNILKDSWVIVEHEPPPGTGFRFKIEVKARSFSIRSRIISLGSFYIHNEAQSDINPGRIVKRSLYVKGRKNQSVNQQRLVRKLHRPAVGPAHYILTLSGVPPVGGSLEIDGSDGYRAQFLNYIPGTQGTFKERRYTDNRNQICRELEQIVRTVWFIYKSRVYRRARTLAAIRAAIDYIVTLVPPDTIHIEGVTDPTPRPVWPGLQRWLERLSRTGRIR